MSIKEAIDTNWKANARTRIKGCDVVAVICGKHTNEATGVSAEVSIAQEEGIPYFFYMEEQMKFAKNQGLLKHQIKYIIGHGII